MHINSLLNEAFKKRQPLTQLTNAIRLVNGIGDGLPGLIIEKYDCHFSFQIFDKQWLKEQTTLIDCLNKYYKVDYCIIKDRTASSSATPDALTMDAYINKSTSETVVEEYGIKFAVDLNDGLNNGLFLDMRRNRREIARLSVGKKVLNCFAYTCSFGVHCKKAGAKEVVNVDISQKCLARGRHNYELNALPISAHEFTKADALFYLERAQVKNNTFDLIILDPPSFSRHGKEVFSVKKDLGKLVNLSLSVLNPKGHLFVATNFSGISREQLLSLVKIQDTMKHIKKVKILCSDIDFSGSNLSPNSHLAALLVNLN